MRTRHVPKLFGLAVLIGAGLALTGCDGTVESSAGYKGSTPAADVTTPSSTTAHPSTTGKATSIPTPRTTTTTAKQTSTTPKDKINLSVVTQPTCPVHGTPDAPFSSPGTDITIAWTVTGADKAALAVDNPKTYAAYGIYPASDKLTLAFGCDGTTGNTTHTYTIWPAGDPTNSKTISVSAQNNP
jgi:hypothetical protein